MGSVLAIFGKIFPREMKRSIPRVDREKLAPPGIRRGAQSFHIRVATASMCPSERAGLRGKYKRSGRPRFARWRAELLRAVYGGRSEWRQPFAMAASAPGSDKTLRR